MSPGRRHEAAPEPSVPACRGCRSRSARPPLRSGGSRPVIFSSPTTRLGLATQLVVAADGPGLHVDRGAGDVLAERGALAAWIAGPGGRARDDRRHRPSGAPRAPPGRPPTRRSATWRGAALPPREVALPRCCATSLRRLADDAHVLSLSTLGGTLRPRRGVAARAEPAGRRRRPAQVAARGVADAARQGGRRRSRARAVDVSPPSCCRSSSSSAAARRSATRTACGPCSAPCRGGRRRAAATAPRSTISSCSRTGGARGITAETLRELARARQRADPHRPHRRSSTSRRALAACADADAGCASTSSPQVRSGALRSSRPPRSSARPRQVLALREMRANLDDFARPRRHGRVPRRRRSRRVRPGASDRRRRGAPRADRRRRPRRRRDRGQAARRQDAARAGRASSRPRCSACCCCSATCARNRCASCRCSARSPAATATAARPTTRPPTS